MERAQEYAVFYTEAELKAIQILIEAYIHGHLSKPLTERIAAFLLDEHHSQHAQLLGIRICVRPL